MLVGNPNGWDDLEQTAVKLAGSDLLASLYLVRHNVKRTAVVLVAQSVHYTVLVLRSLYSVPVALVGATRRGGQSFSA